MRLPVNLTRCYDDDLAVRGLHTVEDLPRLFAESAPVYARTVGAWLPQVRTARIFEAACGPGPFLHFLKQAGYLNVQGTDTSAPAVHLAQAAGLPARQADSIKEIRETVSDSLDAVVAIDFIEHLPRSTFLDFLDGAFRALKHGGVLILRMPNGDSPLGTRNLFNGITHEWAYTSTAMKALAAAAGFSRTDFADDTVAGLRKLRWLKAPVMLALQALIRGLVRAATRERIDHFGSSLYVAAWKD